MDNSNNHKSISSKAITETGMDFNKLVDEGIEAIRKLSGHIWTNHNPVDPGITILEHFCYAITDLSYRLSFPIADILTSNQKNDQNLKLSADNIFSCNPLTINDYRCLLLDIPGVKGAWLEIAQEFSESHDDSVYLAYKGLYKVKIQLENTARSVISEVKQVLHKHRNLGGDFLVEKVEPTLFKIQVDIEIIDGADFNALCRELFIALDNFISPRINFYSLDELLKEGVSVENIFSGPILCHGFIKEDELNNFGKESTIYLTDIISIIYKNPKIKLIKSILINDDPSISLTNQIEGHFLLESLKINGKQFNKPDIIVKEKKRQDIKPPQGSYRNLKEYTMIRDELPRIYSASDNFGSENSNKIAHVKQLQGYLLFFDQILANYFAQLDEAKNLFNLNSKNLEKTYFSQNIDNSLLKEGSDQFFNSVDNYQRKNRLLDHLLAIFGDSYIDYSSHLEKTDNHNKNIIANKMKWLTNYSQMSSMRAKGIDHTTLVDATELKKRIADMLYISESNFYIIEHILLRNFTDRNKNQIIADFVDYDPYSCQISFIFNISLFKKEVKPIVQEIIEKEVPIHLKVNAIWLDDQKLESFKQNYNKWRELIQKFIIKNKIQSVDLWMCSKDVLSTCLGKKFTGIGVMQIDPDLNSKETPFKVERSLS